MKCACGKEMMVGTFVVRLEGSTFPVEWLEGVFDLGRTGLVLGGASDPVDVRAWRCPSCGALSLEAKAT